MTELPLNGRNYAQLALMVPGVSPVTQAGAGGAFGTAGTGLDSHVDMSVNGNQSNANMWTGRWCQQYGRRFQCDAADLSID